MRVALSGYFWAWPHTGSGQYLRHLWGELSASQARDSFALLMAGGQSDGRWTMDDGQRTTDERRKRKASGPSWAGGPFRKLHKVIWEQWGVLGAARQARAQLLHVPYLSAPLRKSLPVVVTAHDMIPWVVPGYSGSPAMRLYLALSAAGVRRARFIIADSDASRRDVLRVLKVSPKRVRTVYLGVEQPREYSPEEFDEVRARFGLPHHYAFYLGGFDRRKNVPLLLRAWRRAAAELSAGCPWCAEERPVLAIGGAVPDPGGIFPDVRTEASALGLTGRDGQVRFLGRIADADKLLLMAAARLFVYSSAYEGFGLDPLEAMSAGCPVVSSSGGSLPEVVGDAGLLVPPEDEGALCEAVVRAWTGEALLADLKRRGRERARLFTWKRTAEQTREIYGEALTRAKRPNR